MSLPGLKARVMCGNWLKSFVSTILNTESEPLADSTAWNLQETFGEVNDVVFVQNANAEDAPCRLLPFGLSCYVCVKVRTACTPWRIFFLSKYALLEQSNDFARKVAKVY